jgi:NAD+ kinase
MFKSVGLIARYDKKKAMQLTDTLADHLKRKGLEVCVEDTLAGKTKTKHVAVPLEQMHTDFVITIGGDGTILRACISLPKPEPPVLAVNMGVRGFLTEVTPQNAIEAVDTCLNGEYNLEKCMKLAVQANGTGFPDALNEIVLLADEPARLIYARVSKNNKHILNCLADGLMVSTQTGSTGYSLSAGGPVLDPDVDSYVLTPICALSVFKPIVFPANSTLSIDTVRPKKVVVLVDGKYRQTISSRSPSLTVKRSKNVTTFIRIRENFYERLKSRLLFKGIG